MFSKKDEKKKNSADEVVELTGFKYSVMPADFFGGRDPEVHYQSDKVEISRKAEPPKPVPPVEVKAVAPPPLPATKLIPKRPDQSKVQTTIPKSPLPMTRPKKKGKIIYVVLTLLLIILFSLVLVWFFFWRTSGVADDSAPVATPNRVERPTVPVDVVTTTRDDIVQPVVVTTPRATSTVVGRITMPRQNFIRARDTDADLLSDAEEVLLGTDSEVWDSDGDGFYDGQEVFNLYNPLGLAPVRIISSGIVGEYINSGLGYHIYHPISWQARAVNGNLSHMLVSAPNGEYIEIRRIGRDLGEGFADWFARNIEGEDYTSLTPITNHFGIAGFVRRDGLVVYFPLDSYVYLMVYHSATGSEEYEYRNILALMYQSFRIGDIAELTEDEARDRLIDLRERDIIITRPLVITASSSDDVSGSEL
jgi:hypothetical protein